MNEDDKRAIAELISDLIVKEVSKVAEDIKRHTSDTVEDNIGALNVRLHNVETRLFAVEKHLGLNPTKIKSSH